MCTVKLNIIHLSAWLYMLRCDLARRDSSASTDSQMVSLAQYVEEAICENNILVQSLASTRPLMMTSNSEWFNQTSLLTATCPTPTQK